MNRELLNKYKKNKRDIENLDGIIAKLQERLMQYRWYQERLQRVRMISLTSRSMCR